MAATPTAFVVSTGTEITQGLYADTNAMNISRRLLQAGFEVVGHCAVPDDEARIGNALRRACESTDLVIATGGLGPTLDDLNREIIARLWDSPLKRDAEAERAMRDRFAGRGIPMPDENLKQADVPEAGEPLQNPNGTAAGILMRAREDKGMLVALPGPPMEWAPMLDDVLERHILPAFEGRLPVIRIRSLHLAMTPESQVNRWLKPLFGTREGVRLALLASRGVVRVRAEARAGNAEEADRLAKKAIGEARALLPADCIFDDRREAVSPEQVVIERYAEAGKTIATAESCTGGWLSKRLTDVPGSSDVLKEGLVTYSNEAKMRYLYVSAEALEKHGAVSKETVLAMARGVVATSDADVGIAISGIAGPGGGTEERPVGTVWFGVAGGGGPEWAICKRMPGDREAVRHWSCNMALDLLRRRLDGLEPVHDFR